MVDSSNLRASAARESSCGVKSNGVALPFQPTITGVAAARFPVTASSATPDGADSHLYPLQTSASTPQCIIVTGAAPASWVTSTTTRAPTARARATSAATSTWLPVANCTALTHTTVVPSL